VWWRAARSSGLCGLASGLALTGLELYFLRGAPLTLRIGGVVAAVVLAASLAVGLVAGAGWWALGRLVALGGARRADPRPDAPQGPLRPAPLAADGTLPRWAALLAAPPLAVAAHATLRGPRISARVPVWLSVPIVVALATAALALLLRTVLQLRRGASLPFRSAPSRLGALLLAAAGAALFALNATRYRRLYPAAHLTAGLLSALLLFCAAAILGVDAPRRRPPRAAAVPGLAASALVLALLAWVGLRGSAEVRFVAVDRSSVAGPLVALWPAASERAAVWTEPRDPGHRGPRRGLRAPTGSMGRPTFPTAHLVLISIDALRADRLDAKAHGAWLMPNLRAVAERSWRFRRAYAQAPHSAYSLGSLMTSDYLHSTLRLGGRIPPTLATVLRARGFHTEAYFSNGVFFTGQQQLAPLATTKFGFEEAHDASGWDAAKLTDAATERLAELVHGGEPQSFLWLHYFDVHEPYERRPHGPFAPGANGVDTPMARYDSEAAYTDHELGRLLRTLQQLQRPTVVVVTADHGEEFKEHGGDYHGSSVYEEQVRVPLLVGVLPGAGASGAGASAMLAHRDVPEPAVELVDVAPTVLALLGLEPPPTMRGDDLLELAAAPTQAPPVYSEVDTKKMVVAGHYKLVHDYKRSTFELYDLQRDPRERESRYDHLPQVARERTADLHRWFDDLGRTASAGEVPEAIARGRVGDQRAVAALGPLLLDRTQPTAWRAEAALLLGRLNDDRARAPLRRAAGVDDGTPPPPAGGGAPAAPAPDDPLVVAEAAIALGELLDRSAAPRLLTHALTQRDLGARARAAIALARLGDPRATPYLVEAIAGADPQLRYRAVHYAGLLRDPRAVEPLLGAASDLRVRYLAALSLGRIGAAHPDARLLPFLLELLRQETYTDIRCSIVMALGLLGDPAAIPTLVALLPGHPELTTLPETLTRLGALRQGAVVGVDFAPERLGLGPGVARCHREVSDATEAYLGATTCVQVAPSASLELRTDQPVAPGGQLLMRLRPRALDPAKAPLALVVDGAPVGAPVVLAAGWQELRLLLDHPLSRGRHRVELRLPPATCGAQRTVAARGAPTTAPPLSGGGEATPADGPTSRSRPPLDGGTSPALLELDYLLVAAPASP
jgi:arylsulfatase A-like enzyme